MFWSRCCKLETVCALLICRVCLQTSRRFMSKLRRHKAKAPFVPRSLAFYWHSGSDNWGRKHSNLHHFAYSNWPITDISAIATGLKEMYIRGGAYLLSPNNSHRFKQPHCDSSIWFTFVLFALFSTLQTCTNSSHCWKGIMSKAMPLACHTRRIESCGNRGHWRLFSAFLERHCRSHFLAIWGIQLNPREKREEDEQQLTA